MLLSPPDMFTSEAFFPDMSTGGGLNPPTPAVPALTPAGTATPSKLAGEPVDEDVGGSVLQQVVLEMELLPALIDLVEEMRAGRLSVQEFNNQAGPIRRKLFKIKQNIIMGVSGLDESPEQRDEKVRVLHEMIERKRQLMARFKDVVGQRFDLSPPLAGNVAATLLLRNS